MVIKWIQNIMNTGIAPWDDLEKAKRIRLTNLMMLTVFVTGTPFVIIFYTFCGPLTGIILLGYVLSFLSIYFLNKARKHLIAKCVMIALKNIAVIHFAIWFGEPTGLHHMLIPFACVPFLVFERHLKLITYIGLSISIIGFFIVDFGRIEPMLPLTEQAIHVVYHAITVMAMIWIVLEMYYLANQNALAFNALDHQRKSQTSSIINAQEVERNRIARELHDGLGQLLSAIKLQLTRKEKEGEKADPAIDLLDQAVNETKNMAFNLMPSSLELKGLVPAAKELVQRVHNSNKFQAKFQSHKVEEMDLSEEVQLNVYRIIQEGINNIIKHSNASEVLVQLTRQDYKTLSIIIEDNGKGFDLKKSPKGRGLNNIHARTEWMDGALVIDSIPGSGTTLVITIPVR